MFSVTSEGEREEKRKTKKKKEEEVEEQVMWTIVFEMKDRMSNSS